MPRNAIGLARYIPSGETVREGIRVTSTNRTRRLIAAGAFAVAAVAAPFAAAALGTTSDNMAAPECLAWFGNREDGKCLSYSEGNGVNVGTPGIGIGNTDGNGPIGVTTGPLLPGSTFETPIG
jgi:hypothetical protein